MGAWVMSKGISRCWTLPDYLTTQLNSHGIALQVAPTAMIFIPCRKGLSHHPDEYAAPEDLERGIKTLALTLAQLAGTSPEQEIAEGGAEHTEL